MRPNRVTGPPSTYPNSLKTLFKGVVVRTLSFLLRIFEQIKYASKAVASVWTIHRFASRNGGENKSRGSLISSGIPNSCTYRALHHMATAAREPEMEQNCQAFRY